MFGLESKKDLIYSHLNEEILKFDFNCPSVVFGRTMYKTISKISGIEDPFEKEKIYAEKKLLKSEQSINRQSNKSKDSLHMACKMSAAANTIDFGIGKIPNVEKLLFQLKDLSLNIDHFSIFKRKLSNCKKIMILGDNCAESVFDKMLIKEIKRYKKDIEIFYVVRSSPIINDVVLSDAKRIGIDNYAKVISSGCDYPGLIFEKTSSQFKRIYSHADLVISKGQGNFESYEDKNKDVFYLFKIKCSPVSRYTSLALNSIVFLYNKQ